MEKRGGKRNCRTPFPTNPLDPLSIHPPKVRGRCASEMNPASTRDGRSYRVVSAREASLNIRFDRLTLQPAIPALASDGRSPSPVAPYARPVPIAETDEERPPIPDTLHGEVPKTPSHIPKLASTRNAVATKTPSPSKAPQKTPKTLQRFLNRATNTTIAFDTDSRLEEMENSLVQFKEKIDGATSESRGLRETMAVYKIRSTCRAYQLAD